jgi:hypothetical protein
LAGLECVKASAAFFTPLCSWMGFFSRPHIPTAPSHPRGSSEPATPLSIPGAALASSTAKDWLKSRFVPPSSPAYSSAHPAPPTETIQTRKALPPQHPLTPSNPSPCHRKLAARRTRLHLRRGSTSTSTHIYPSATHRHRNPHSRAAAVRTANSKCRGPAR